MVVGNILNKTEFIKNIVLQIQRLLHDYIYI